MADVVASLRSRGRVKWFDAIKGCFIVFSLPSVSITHSVDTAGFGFLQFEVTTASTSSSTTASDHDASDDEEDFLASDHHTTSCIGVFFFFLFGAQMVFSSFLLSTP